MDKQSEFLSFPTPELIKSSFYRLIVNIIAFQHVFYSFKSLCLTKCQYQQNVPQHYYLKDTLVIVLKREVKSLCCVAFSHAQNAPEEL